MVMVLTSSCLHRESPATSRTLLSVCSNGSSCRHILLQRDSKIQKPMADVELEIPQATVSPSAHSSNTVKVQTAASAEIPPATTNLTPKDTKVQ